MLPFLWRDGCSEEAGCYLALWHAKPASDQTPYFNSSSTVLLVVLAVYSSPYWSVMLPILWRDGSSEEVGFYLALWHANPASDQTPYFNSSSTVFLLVSVIPYCSYRILSQAKEQHAFLHHMISTENKKSIKVLSQSKEQHAFLHHMTNREKQKSIEIGCVTQE